MNVNWIWNRCRRYRRDAALLASGVLTDAEKTAVAAHFAKCGTCRRQYQALAIVGGRLDALGARLPAVEPTTALRTRWTNAVKAETRPPTMTVAKPRRWWDWWLASKRPACAGLAGVWLLILFFHVTAPELPPVSHRSVAVAPRELLIALRAKLDRSSIPQEAVEPPPIRPDKSGRPLPRSDRRRDQMPG